MTREVRILCGIPGVGKSYWAAQEVKFLEADGYSVAYISRDAIRFAILELRGGDYFDYETEVFNTFIEQINEALRLGFDYVIADATHISHASRMKTLRRLTVDGQTNVVFEVFDYPIEVALYRNGLREGLARVPVSAIKSMKQSFKAPNETECISIGEELHWDNTFYVKHHRWEEK